MMRRTLFLGCMSDVTIRYGKTMKDMSQGPLSTKRLVICLLPKPACLIWHEQAPDPLVRGRDMPLGI